MIAAIEAHRRAHGRYPPSLVALNPDYFAPTVGVQGYQYALRGESFNLSFEQPRFFLDNIGAREIVVYNPLDQHLFMSHAAWILEWSPEALATRQGWHDAHDAGIPHWKFFWFD